MTWFFLLTLVFADMGGGGEAVIRAQFTSEPLCKAVRRAIWSQLPDMNGWLSECVMVGSPDPVEEKLAPAAAMPSRVPEGS